MFRRARGERGVSLLEVLVALAILSTALLSLIGLAWQMARQTRYSGYATSRTAALEGAASLALAADWDSLPALVGCEADSASARFTYTRCYEITTIGNTLREIRVIVAPDVYGVKTETLTVERTKPLLPSPLYRP